MEPSVTCCFTGHRPTRLPWGSNEDDPRCIQLKQTLSAHLKQAYADGCRHFICGMAQGADLYFCEAALHLRSFHPEVTVEAAIPFVGQADRWPQEDRLRRQRLLDQCNFETMVQHHYSAGCMARRNRYMVDRSCRLIAVYDGQPKGGTFQTLHYAMTHGVRTIILEL